jgi:gamma-glutamyl phosphate reductase
MTKPMIKLVNAETGEEVVREMNAEELKQWDKDIAEAQAAKAEAASKAEAKQAVLDRLGLTTEEAALLLG